MSRASGQNILLATDGSPAAECALRAAASISEKTGANLHVVYVVSYVPPPAFHPYPGFEDDSRLAVEEAEQFLRCQVWKVNLAGAEMVRSHLREGAPKKEIAALAKKLDADLVVVGSRGVGRIRRLAGRSVSEGVAHEASSPVLVVSGEEGAWPPTKILVGDDGSMPAARAGELATEFARLFGAEIELVRAYEKPPEPMTGWSSKDRLEMDEVLQRNREGLQERARQLEVRSRCRPQTRISEMRAALAMQSAAKRQHHERVLLAVGSRGLGPVERTLLGSVSTEVLRSTNVPTLVVPRPSARRFSQVAP